MKAKVVIYEKETRVVLTPENIFETDILKKIYEDERPTATEKKYELFAAVEADYKLYNYENHRIEILLREKYQPK